MHRQQDQLNAAGESTAERDAKADLPARNSQKARKKNQEQDQTELHQPHRTLQSEHRMNHRFLVGGVGSRNHHGNQQHHQSRPLEYRRSQILESVIRTEDVEKDFMNNLEVQHRIERLRQPVEPEIPLVADSKDGIYGIGNRKNGDL